MNRHLNRHQLLAEIEFDAPLQRVWEILTDFAGMTFRPRVLVAETGRELCWRGRLLLPGIFDGVHRFVIEPLAATKVLFRHNEEFSGILVPLFRASIDRDTKRGFDEMNLALKARAEPGATSGQ